MNEGYLETAIDLYGTTEYKVRKGGELGLDDSGKFVQEMLHVADLLQHLPPGGDETRVGGEELR